MSDYTDMMLEGIFCQGCGECLAFDDDDVAGFPQSCSACADDEE